MDNRITDDAAAACDVHDHITDDDAAARGLMIKEDK